MSDEVRSSELWEESRFQIETEGTGFTMTGPMAIFDMPSKLLSIRDLGPNEQARSQLERYGRGTPRFREVVHVGSFKKSFSEHPDIVLHYQHDENTLPLGRTTAGTLAFAEETRSIRGQDRKIIGTRAELPDNEWGRPVRDAVQRGDIGGISFRMGKILDKWGRETLDDGYTGAVRHIHEIQLRREVSLVTFPGYLEATATIRALADEADLEPDALADAFSVLRTPDAKLTVEQRDLLMTAINTRVDEPWINPKLASMRERLEAAIAR